MNAMHRVAVSLTSLQLSSPMRAAWLGLVVCASAAFAQTAPATGAGAEKPEADSVVVCGTCATVISVRSETRVARKGVGTTSGANLDSGVLGDQPEGRGINDTTNAPPGTTSAGLVMPKGDRRLAGSTVWTVILQRRDGSTASVQVPDDPVLRPGDTVNYDGGRITSDKR